MNDTSPGRLLILLVAGLFVASGSPWAQECHDWDADSAEAGWECSTSADCEDRSWWRRPGAEEICDGLDNDCDGSLDLGCDRSCGEPFLFLEPQLLDQPGLETADQCFRLTDHGFVLTYPYNWGHPDRILIHARGFDREGFPRDEEQALGDLAEPTPRDQWCGLAVGGDRVLVTWQDRRTYPDTEGYVLRGRVVDDLGRPVGPALDLSSPVGRRPRFHDAATVWDGERFVAFWTAASTGTGEKGELWMSVIHPDGSPADPLTRLVTDNADGYNSTIQYHRALWTGEHFLVVLNRDGTAGPDPPSNFVVLKVSREGLPVGLPMEIPHTGRDPEPVLMDDRVAVVWHRQELGVPFQAFVSLLDLDGNPLDPPGVIELPVDRTDLTFTDIRAAWTGEMLGIVLDTYNIEVPGLVSRWYFWRALPDGTLLDPTGVMLDEGTEFTRLHGLLWAGEEFWLFGYRDQDGTFLMHRHRIVCSCQDLDGDLFNACAHRDCDDRDPEVHRFASEVCRGLKDDDCDGAIDCADDDCPGGAGPASIDDLGWNGGTIVWSAPAGAERYDLARGLLSDVKRRDDFLQSECPGPELDSPSWPDDGRLPPSGDVLWYLVRPEGAPCALGSWGATDSSRDVNVCR